MVRAIKSAERTLALFELFSRVEHPLTVTQVARELDIPQPSATMLLYNLVERGYLDWDREQRTFIPTMRVMLLGSWIERRFQSAGNIVGRLQGLHERLDRMSVVLAIQNGSALQYVLAILDEEKPNRLHVESGALRPLPCSAAGRALLSLKPDAEVIKLVRRCNAETREERFKVQERPYLDLIHAVRQRGYAMTAGDVTAGIGAIAITIPPPMGTIPLAVAVGGPIDQLQANEQRIVSELAAFRSLFPEPSGTG